MSMLLFVMCRAEFASTRSRLARVGNGVTTPRTPVPASIARGVCAAVAVIRSRHARRVAYRPPACVRVIHARENACGTADRQTRHSTLRGTDGPDEASRCVDGGKHAAATARRS